MLLVLTCNDSWTKLMEKQPCLVRVQMSFLHGKHFLIGPLNAQVVHAVVD